MPGNEIPRPPLKVATPEQLGLEAERLRAVSARHHRNLILGPRGTMADVVPGGSVLDDLDVSHRILIDRMASLHSKLAGDNLPQSSGEPIDEMGDLWEKPPVYRE